MLTTIPLTTFLKTNELGEGSIVLAHTEMFRPVPGIFEREENGLYEVKFPKPSVIFGDKSTFVPGQLSVVINVQKFNAVSFEDKDIEPLLHQ